MNKARLTFLGTGTSLGVPIIGCKCPQCTSTDPKDKRFRASALVRYGGLNILIDAGPDFRSQMIASGITHLDAILLTHNHKDHTGGLDDIRALNYVDQKVAEIYCEEYVVDALKREYGYAFCETKYPGAPEWHVHIIDDKPFVLYPDDKEKSLVWVRNEGYRYMLKDGSIIPIGNPIDISEKVQDQGYTGLMHGLKGNGIEIIPIRGYHDKLPVLGFRFGNIAYITDMSSLPESELAKLKNLDHVSLNTVSYNPHHSHFSLDQALELADRIGAKNTWLTHLSHSFPVHDEFIKELDSLCKSKGIKTVVRPAYDGLTID